jgi:flagellar motor switch protein FliG
MGPADPEAVQIVAENLRARTGTSIAPGFRPPDNVGGVEPLVDIINRANAATERTVLEGLTERDPELAEEVRSKMLTFADIAKLERRDIQQVLRGVDVAVLARAMRGATEPVLDAITSNISDRNQALLESEIETLGPLRASEVEEARADVVRSMRELDAAGTIILRRNEEDQLVY